MSLDPKYLTQPKRGPQCSVGRALATLEGDRLDLLTELLSTSGVVWSKVEEHSEDDLGIHIAASSLSRHARNKCACHR